MRSKSSIEFVLNTIVACICLQQKKKVNGDVYLYSPQDCGRPTTSFLHSRFSNELKKIDVSDENWRKKVSEMELYVTYIQGDNSKHVSLARDTNLEDQLDIICNMFDISMDDVGRDNIRKINFIFYYNFNV